MYGLRPEIDPSGRLNPFHHPKSQKFSEHLAGRQYVSGISGGFRKTRRQSAEGDDPVVDQAAVAAALRQAERRLQKEDQIRKDAMRLREIEDKLEEIRQQKELRKRRDTIRNEKRRQFSAAVIIQNVMKRFLYQNLYRQRLNVAVDVVQNFLQSMAAKQAVAAGAWAAAVLARFATRLKLSWVGRKRLARLRLRRQRQQQIERQLLLQEEQERQQQQQQQQQQLAREREEQERLQAEHEAYLLSEAAAVEAEEAAAAAAAAAVVEDPVPVASIVEADTDQQQQPVASPLVYEGEGEIEAGEEDMAVPVEAPPSRISSNSNSNSSSSSSSSKYQLPSAHLTTQQHTAIAAAVIVTIEQDDAVGAVDNDNNEDDDEGPGGAMVEGESAEDRLRRLHDQKMRARTKEREKVPFPSFFSYYSILFYHFSDYFILSPPLFTNYSGSSGCRRWSRHVRRERRRPRQLDGE